MIYKFINEEEINDDGIENEKEDDNEKNEKDGDDDEDSCGCGPSECNTCK